MEPTSRRQFLKRTGTVAAATAAVAAVPATAAKALSRSDANNDGADADHPDVEVAVFAHVKDVSKGIVSLYAGEEEIVVKNKRLAAALYHASR